MDPWMTRLVEIGRFLALIVLGFGVLVFLVQRRLAFPGTMRDVGRTVDTAPRGAQRIWLDTSFGRVEAWFFTAEAEGPRPTIIFAHGNGELIDDWRPAMADLAEAGVHALAVEFPGYGLSDGSPTRRTIRETFAMAFDRMAARADVDPDGIVAYGRSMGGGAAGDLARDRPLGALILQSTFSSTMAIARETFVPGFLVRDRFDNVRAVREFPGPILLMHGPRDDVISFSHAETLAAARENLQITPIDCAHNDCARVWPDIAATVVGFLRSNEILR